MEIKYMTKFESKITEKMIDFLWMVLKPKDSHFRK